MTTEPGPTSSDETPTGDAAAAAPETVPAVAAEAPAEADVAAEPAAEQGAEPPAAAEPAAEQAAEPPAAAEPAAEQTAEAPAAGDTSPAGEAPKRKRGPRRRGGRGTGAASSGPRPAPARLVPKSTRAQLPIDDLRDASRAMLDVIGPRQATRDAFSVLGPRERQDLNQLIAAEDDHRPRARNIANGSLGAGRIDKAMAATIISMAPLEELWGVALDKEQAAQKLGRIREAKQRDEQRAKRAAERANRDDRISREDLEKARDGSVGAKVRIVVGSEKRERAKKDEQPAKKPSVLDKLGY